MFLNLIKFRKVFKQYLTIFRSRRFPVELVVPDPLDLVAVQGQRHPPQQLELGDAASPGHALIGADQQSYRLVLFRKISFLMKGFNFNGTEWDKEK